MIQTIDAVDTPNQGRVKINSNFESVQSDSTGKLNIDGSNKMLGNIDMNGNRSMNAGAGINDNDYITKSQMITETNHLVVRRYIYCSPNFNQTQRILYLDGTNSDFGIKVNSLSTALSFAKDANDATFGNEWSIKVPYKSDYWINESFVNFSNWLNIFGEGKPVIEISDGTTVGVADIIGHSKISDVTLVYKDGYELNLGGDVFIEDCNIIMSKVEELIPRKININGAKIINCNIIADDIELDGTTGNFIDGNVISVQNFINPSNNDVNAVNKSNVNLKNYYELYSTI